jgi:hypothetical protein
MYQFNIVKNDDSSWRFELDGIQLIVDDYQVRNERHFIRTPNKAIAFFNIDGNLYGLANQAAACPTAEDFYDLMRRQYKFFQ